MLNNEIGKPGDELMIINRKLIASVRWDKELGEKLRSMRGKESMQSLAKRAGCAYQLIQHLERGGYPEPKDDGNLPPQASVSMEKLEGICNALSIRVETFLKCPLVVVPLENKNIA
ncbi:MAG: helix-turn-helix domain-containing protein [Scytonematopsis contorta HA4267-MV1]|jgi:transcriptional regulator with XRE-family HTH domain|nr:helix-turn-helix domain-containing protein [Scytonematopsis contorta HA4267-MV1]